MATILESQSTDVVLEEVRRIKDELAKAFDYDVDRILADARENQDQSGHPLVLPPKKSAPRKTA